MDIIVASGPSSIAILGPILVIVFGGLYTFKYWVAYREQRRLAKKP